jgi:4-amino-4-deoxy-L-arabinose transferase-like glycosyltransferase
MKPAISNHLNPERLRSAGFVVVVVALALGFQGTRGLWSPDEGYHAVIARSMLESGDWLVPHVVNQTWLDKPPLAHWGIAAGMRVLGVNEWGARLSHAMWYALTILLVFILGRSFWDDRGGRLAAVLYATMLLPFSAANVVTPDTPLTFWTTATLTAFWFARDRSNRQAEWWKVALGFALALGMWTKGPAALLPGGAMLIFLFATGALRSFFLSWGLVVGGVTFLTLGLSWYAYVGATVPGALPYLWDNHVVGRLVSTSYRRNPGLIGAVRIYLPVLLVGTLPGGVAFWLAAKRGWRAVARADFWRRLRKNPADLLLVCWVVVPSLVLAAASSKLTLYILPVFPALALLFARLARGEAETRGTPVGWLGLPTRLNWLLAVWLVALLALKLAGGMVDDRRDMRRLAMDLHDVLPAPPYEIVCVDQRCEGLVFYLGGAVERVTTSSRPYPVFGGTELVTEELAELPESSYHHVILFPTPLETSLEELLQPYAGLCSDQPVVLPGGCQAIVCPAAREPGAVVEPEPHQLGQKPQPGSFTSKLRHLRRAPRVAG